MTLINLCHISAFIVGFVFPIYAISTGNKTKRLAIEHPNSKIIIFRQTGSILIFLAILSIIPFLIYSVDLDVIGLHFLDQPIWVIGLFAIPVLTIFLLKSVKLNLKSATKFYEANKAIQFLLPNTKEELNLTIVVSFIAGICEEIIYRGFLFWYLAQYMPMFAAVVLANLPFALGHLTTTGIKNTFGAFILAFIFSGSYFLTKSLWLPILLHIIVDLYAMIFAYKAYHKIHNTKY